MNSFPQDLRGIALSGGGIRSAAVSLGALQALHAKKSLLTFDYLSTVSGGGYTGACLSVAMSENGGEQFPFGEDIKDSPVVGHIRNHSNYLVPRNRSGLRNWAEAGAVVLRGLVANGICVLAFLLPFVLLMALAFPNEASLADANFLPRLIHGIVRAASGKLQLGARAGGEAFGALPFKTSLAIGGALVITLASWAALKAPKPFDRLTDDGNGPMLALSRWLLLATGAALFLDLQPILISAVRRASASMEFLDSGAIPTLVAILTAVAVTASRLGRFLETSKRTSRWRTSFMRLGARAALMVGASVVPLLLWLTYVIGYLWVISVPTHIGSFHPDLRTPFDWVLAAYALSFVLIWCYRANNYSLHWLYRDRLGRAFLVSEAPKAKEGKTESLAHSVDSDSRDAPDLQSYVDRKARLHEPAKIATHLPIKLSDLAKSSGPYPIINAAINLQGSLEANKRGRDADFFVFTPDFVGSELTRFVPTRFMQLLEPRMDLASAVAISGAAASANMGGRTVRLLSPTLALLNVRLGYYLRNPRWLGVGTRRHRRWRRFVDRFFLFKEMFNALNERAQTVYLSDGGHIENLGIYQLLRRGCSVILAVDAEADPEFGCGSLLRLERYARIDLGLRISLPWEAIARQSRATSNALASGSVTCDRGPHCAIGRIFYADKTEGILVYVKSSLSGDERDYILDYARRNPTFPHEGTGDQFFSEEQFEMYRSLGFHMMDGTLESDRIAFLEDPDWGFVDERGARDALLHALRPSPEVKAKSDQTSAS